MDCTLEEIDDPIDFASPLEMEMLLKEWPMQVQIFVSSTVYLFIFIFYDLCFQIDKICLEDVGHDCDRPVLSALGEHLIRLHIESVRRLDLVNLLSCIRLEELTLCDDASMKMSRPLTETETQRLFPRLKKTSNFCSSDESHVCRFISSNFPHLDRNLKCEYWMDDFSSE